MQNVELIALISGAAIAIAFALLVSLQRGLRERMDELTQRLESREAELDGLRRAVEQAGTDAAAARRREAELAEQLTLLARQQEQMLIRDPDGGPYMQAVRAACSGASAETLMSTFGLSRGEAELVVTLHRPPSDSDA